MPYDAEHTRRRIFDAASVEFAEHGLAGARVDRIATAAGANKQAIYLYYGSKEKLFAAVLRAKLAEVRIDLTADRPDAVAESVGQVFDWYQQHPDLIRLLLWEALETPDDDVDEDRRDAFRDKATQLVGEGLAGHLPERDRLRATQDLLFTVMSLIAWNFAVPAMCRATLNEPTTRAALARRRQAVIEAARTLATGQRSP